MYLRLGVAFVWTAVVMSAGVEARADDVALADGLFKKGIVEMEAARYEAACPAIAESLRLDKRPGTIETLAHCEDMRGRLATASALYEDYLREFSRMTGAQRNKHESRAAKAQARLAELAQEVPELTVTVACPPGVEVEVFRDDVRLGRGAWGLGLPIDPGEHTIKAVVGGKTVDQQQVKLGPSERKKVALVVPDGPRQSSTPGPPKTVPSPGRPSLTNSDSEPSNAVRVLGWTLGGAGVIAGVAGVVTGVLAIDAKEKVNDNCDERLYCSSTGLAAAADGLTLANASTATLATGGALIAAGAVMLWLGPKGPQGATRVGLVHAGPGQVVFGVKGSFQ